MGPAHLGIAFAAKPAAPKVPLLALLVASEALDLLSAPFIALGMERMAVTHTDLEQGMQYIVPGSVPWSHGLFMSLVWSAVFAAITYLLLRDRRASLVMGLVVFSHWVLDLIVHLPDLPLLFEGSPVLGLGLWGSGPGLVASAILELVLLIGGIVVYVLWRRRSPSRWLKA